VVFIYPNWWGTYPAIFKGFLDKLLWPGFAFNYRKGSTSHEKLMKGKSARIIVTMDNPYLYYRFIQGGGGLKAMKYSTLKFCGFSPVRVLPLGGVKKASPETIAKWMKNIEKLGKKIR
jgi:NAD(P)H dehydrogenase (quinone)